MLVYGTTSIPVSGSSDFFGGNDFFLPPAYLEGGGHMVTWSDLIGFCTFLVMLISLILEIEDHNNKEK